MASGSKIAGILGIVLITSAFGYYGYVNGWFNDIIQKPVGNFEFFDGFEGGNTTLWSSQLVTTGETVSVTSDAHTGSYGLRCTTTNGGSDDYAMVRMTNYSRTTMYARGYFKILTDLSSVLSEGNRLNFIVFYGSGNIAVGKLNNAIVFQLRYSNSSVTGGWTVLTASNSVQINRWYCLEYDWITGGATNKEQLWIDNTLAIEHTGIATKTISDVRFGLGVTLTSTTNTVSFQVDDCAINNTHIGT